jgi:glutamate carboxypeptidase
MKGGLVLAAMAMERLAGARGAFGEIRLVVCADEEVRIRAPRAVDRVRDAAAALVFECARENGDLVAARKGALWRTLVVTGRAAHAGADTSRGRSAVSALVREIVRIEALPEGRSEMTSVVTTVAGGTAANTVPGWARATVDIRSSDPRDVELAARELAASGPPDGVSIEIEDRGTWPPMPRHDRLVSTARAEAAALGLEIGETLSGGVSDGCWTGALGIPTLDGLGPVGGRDHTHDEYIDISTLEPRVELVARIAQLAARGAYTGTPAMRATRR